MTVIGDVMLDGWWHGTIDRLCREAPAPVVEVDQRLFVPGGAGNTAMNLAAMGAQVRLAGLIGTDFAGRRLRSLLTEADIDTSGLIEHSASPPRRNTASSAVISSSCGWTSPPPTRRLRRSWAGCFRS